MSSTVSLPQLEPDPDAGSARYPWACAPLLAKLTF
jgi:hypothetical protein